MYTDKPRPALWLTLGSKSAVNVIKKSQIYDFPIHISLLITDNRTIREEVALMLSYLFIE